ncbi:MAG: DMT family transporter [Bosea sp. (in: a-proteobacteria)]|uniref:DMT family transporter n=1 Tax=Bosea sp. (in: a-proteobacteria) TaxID=1871050 RepID=UPI00273584CE|nr:DMT family transporter [Bosea sp. (in: a-proteobacteria)]MDP3255806.1 DMT family transporter [Bosea sp. (in: a-proteobacteria)]MDP3320552.1 DMT family transporter [Bosea sp. (in: a-proteobacteria)]
MSAPATVLPAPTAPALAMFLALLTGATCIGFSGVFVRFADVGPAAAGFWRMIFALPVLGLWMGLERRRPGHPAASGGAMLPIVLAGLAFGVDVVLYNAALGFTTIANASLLGNLSPVAVVLGGWLLFAERPSRRILGALALAIGGALMLVLPKIAGASSGIPGSLFGDSLAVGAALSYAAYIMAVRRARDRAEAGRISLIASAICAVFCLVAALALGEAILPSSLQGWLAVIALGLVSHALGQGLITLSLGQYGASAASLVMVWPALVSVLAAWAIFGEQPSPAQAFGGIAILAAVLMVRKG